MLWETTKGTISRCCGRMDGSGVPVSAELRGPNRGYGRVGAVSKALHGTGARGTAQVHTHAHRLRAGPGKARGALLLLLLLQRHDEGGPASPMCDGPRSV